MAYNCGLKVFQNILCSQRETLCELWKVYLFSIEYCHNVSHRSAYFITEVDFGVFTIISSLWTGYRKFPKYSDNQNICCNHSNIWTMWLCHRVMSPNDADGMANSVDPDQTAPLGAVWSGSALFALGAVWSGSALFAQTCLSEYIGKLR